MIECFPTHLTAVNIQMNFLGHKTPHILFPFSFLFSFFLFFFGFFFFETENRGGMTNMMQRFITLVHIDAYNLMIWI